MKVIPGPEAFRTTLRNKSRRYPNQEDPRFDNGLIFPTIEPGFSISKDQSVFTIGSCFARNVEQVLRDQGISVPTMDFAAPHEEAPGQPNRVLNQYNPGTMMQCVRDANAEVTQDALYKTSFTEVVDCLLATGGRAVSKKRALERRQQIVDLYRTGLERSEVVIITLGLVEAWYDKKTNLYLNEAPPRKVIEHDADRFEFRQLDARACQELVFEMLETLVSSGRRKVLLTVSPVPLQSTFSGGDAVCRNAYSKSVLRVVAELAVQSFADVDYFPSYEIITTSGLASLGSDNVHVRPAVVERAVSYMIRNYIN